MVTFIIFILVLILFFILIHAFSTAEFALFALSTDELKDLSAMGSSSGRWLDARLKRPREFALFFVVARTLFIGLCVVILALIGYMAKGWVVPVLGGLLLWFFIIIFGFALPGTLAKKRRLDIAVRLVPLMRFFWAIFYPLLLFWKFVLGAIASEGGIGGPLAIERELDNLIPNQEGFASLETEEKEMIRHVVEFGDTTVREVMVPRIDMACIPASSTPENAIKVIADAGHSRIPIYSGRIDNIVGILYAKDLLLAISKGEKPLDLAKIARKPYYVPEAKRISDLLREFRSERIHMAIVVDEYGGTAGLVTLEDLIEEIVGEIQDEYDAEEIPLKKISPNVYLVETRLPIDEVNDALNIDLPEDESETLGGFIYGLAGSIPKQGEKLEYKNLIFIIESVVGQRVRYIKIIIKKEENEEK